MKHRRDFLKCGVNRNGIPYASWTKEGVRDWTRYVQHHLEAMDEVHMHLIEQNIKLAALMFSTPAGPSNKEENCGLGTCDGLPCYDLCYAIRAESFRPSAMLADIENALMLKYAPERAVYEFVQALEKYWAKCFRKGWPCMVRWHQAGEFTPEDSALLDKVSGMYEDVSFYGYTKREEYYCKYYGWKNVNILWSAWRGMEIPQRVLECGPLKAFFVEFKDGKNEYMEPFITGENAKRVRRCPGLIKGEFACNRCKFACSKCLIMIAKEH